MCESLLKGCKDVLNNKRGAGGVSKWVLDHSWSKRIDNSRAKPSLIHLIYIFPHCFSSLRGIAEGKASSLWHKCSSCKQWLMPVCSFHIELYHSINSPDITSYCSCRVTLLKIKTTTAKIGFKSSHIRPDDRNIDMFFRHFAYSYLLQGSLLTWNECTAKGFCLHGHTRLFIIHAQREKQLFLFIYFKNKQ